MRRYIILLIAGVLSGHYLSAENILKMDENIHEQMILQTDSGDSSAFLTRLNLNLERQYSPNLSSAYDSVFFEVIKLHRKDILGSPNYTNVILKIGTKKGLADVKDTTIMLSSLPVSNKKGKSIYTIDPEVAPGRQYYYQVRLVTSKNKKSKRIKINSSKSILKP